MKNVKKLGVLVLAGVLVFGGAACGEEAFDGSRTGDAESFEMTYTAFNTTTSQTLTLAEGDTLDVELVSEKGTLALAIQKGEEPPVFSGDHLPSQRFQVGPLEAGDYTVTATGHRAAGSISVIVEK